MLPRHQVRGLNPTDHLCGRTEVGVPCPRNPPKSLECPREGSAMAYDLLFTNGRVLDGTGSPWLSADVAVADGRIVAVGRQLGGEAARTIDVAGQIVAPGF